MNSSVNFFPLTFKSRSFWLPCAALSLILQGLPAGVSAATCSYGENFDFTGTIGGTATQIGNMSNLDIDREAVTVIVTRTGGGNLPAGIIGGQNIAGNDANSYAPSIELKDNANGSYGHGLKLSGSTAADAQVPLTFTFSKTMRNLVMHFNGGDNEVFTFTDENNNPVEVVYHLVTKIGAIPTSGDGSGSNFFIKPPGTTNAIAVGEGSRSTLAFKTPVKTLKVTRTYIGNTLSAATLNSAASAYTVNFGQYCDQPGVVDYCNNINFAEWDSFTYSSSANPDTYVGRVIDADGKAVAITYSGALAQSALISWGGFTNAGNPPAGVEEGSTPYPNRPATDLLYTLDTLTGTATPVTMSWTFGGTVRNPGLIFRGAANSTPYRLNLKFYKADGVTPLPFLLRTPATAGLNRQVDANTLHSQEGWGSMIQFIGDTTGIVMKTYRVDTGAPASITFDTQHTVFLGCNGTMTASGSAIDGDSDGDGVPDLTDKCPGTPTGAVVGADGCPLPTDLSITKSASVSKITPGVPFNYTITVTNTGAQATNVKASDLVPAGLTINSVSASDAGVVTQNGQSVEAVWAIVPDSGVRTLTINVTKP